MKDRKAQDRIHNKVGVAYSTSHLLHYVSEFTEGLLRERLEGGNTERERDDPHDDKVLIIIIIIIIMTDE